MSDSTDRSTVRIRVEGQVQAVGFRDFVISEATALGVDGWVRNRTDGTVEILVSGETKAVEALVLASMRGPKHARVSNIELHPAQPPEQAGFHRRPTD